MLNFVISIVYGCVVLVYGQMASREIETVG